MTTETLTINKPPVDQAPTGHAAAMIAKVDALTAPPADAPTDTRPEWLPGKFSSVEDLAKAYAELESKLGTPKVDTPPVAPVAPTVDATKELQAKGLDINSFSAEFAATGELSADSYAKLATAGYDKTLVDNYIQGQAARTALFATEVKASAGGDEGYVQMITWAQSALSPAEQAAFNKAMDTNNTAEAKLAVAGLFSRFSAESGVEPKVSLAGNRGSTLGDAYESIAQLTAAMKDPRYTSDSAYRAKVQATLARSNIM